MIDIVFPKNNEKEFISLAEQLGYSELCLAYEYISRDTQSQIKEITELQKTTKLKLYFGLLTKPADAAKPKDQADIILVKSSANDRHTLEQAKPDLLFGLENHNKKDYIHHRSSGLNQVMCRIAAQNNIIITFSLESLLNISPIKKSIILGRIKQNLNLCSKYKVKIAIATFAKTPHQMRAPNDMISLALALNADTKQAKQALTAISSAINDKKGR